MVPATAVHVWIFGVDPELPRRIELGGVVTEFVVGTEAQLRLALGIGFGAALLEDLIESPLETAGGAVIRSPVAEPDRARIVAVQGVDDELDPLLMVVVTGDGQ